MNSRSLSRAMPVRLRPYVWGLLGLWTAAAGALLAWEVFHHWQHALEIARGEGRAAIEKDLLFRRWNAAHGGVYVPVTERTQPNPHLWQVPERDITTTSGRRLTLVNPAYMIRQVHELSQAQFGLRGHITSLKPIRPENAPDPWEKEALGAFEQGRGEVSSVETLDGQPYLRLMRPMITEQRCLKCHAPQGYKVGDVRGGISVSVPLATIYAAGGTEMARWTLGYATLWGLGLTGLLLGSRRLRCQIAQRRQAELELRDYTVALESANQALAEFNLAAEAATRAKSEFLANMSHEIRSPMTAILGFADMLAENVDRGTNIDAVNTIKRNGEYLLRIINDILDLSKIEAQKLRIERVACSPAEVVADVLSLMRIRAEAKNLLLEVDYLGSIPVQIQSDPVRLRQILINLVGNAIKFTESGSVRLVTRLIEGRGDRGEGRGAGNCTPGSSLVPHPSSFYLQFDVIDTGIGMTQRQIHTIFQPFTQADTSTSRRFGGTGLGLTISKRLAEMLGGDLAVSSSPGQGSTFSVTIEAGPLDGVPMLDRPAEAMAAGRPEVKPSTAPKVQLNCRILLAEDGPDNRRLICFLLKRAGAHVTVAENGKFAVEKTLATFPGRERPPTGGASQCPTAGAGAENKPFDVILMDMQMPVMDGYQATRKLRAQGYAGPIIALTANAMAEDRQKCLDAGCDDYSPKPIDRAGLLATVARHLAVPRNRLMCSDS